MFERDPEALLRQAERILATQWKDKIRHVPRTDWWDRSSLSNTFGNAFDRYVIDNPDWPDNPIGELLYSHNTDDEGNPYIGVEFIGTRPDHRLQGVATSLLQRMVQDNPGIPVDPGYTTGRGTALKNFLPVPAVYSCSRSRSTRLRSFS